ncbi:MAG: Protein containing rhodanese-like domain, partial [Bacteroidetes bacterium]|nr:Protein containing rhodanese-like domain [Bacteroidota bacterium]
YKDKTIITYCRTGNRSGKAAALLQAQGFKVFNMSGGIVQWNEEHRPVVRDR